MKKTLKSIVALGVLLALVIADPVIAKARYETTAKNIAEVAYELSEAAKNREEKVVITFTGNESDLEGYDPEVDEEEFFSELLYGYIPFYDDPDTSDDADYLVGLFNLGKYGITYSGKKIVFKLKYFETLKQTEYVNAKVKKIVKELGIKGKSNYTKVKKIHDYICKRITYSDKHKDYESTPYGPLKYKKGLCNAYSLFMYKLCIEAGVPCKYIGGFMWDRTEDKNERGGHAWNIVALGDKWYYVDATWDDADNAHHYFLRGTEDFDTSDPEFSHCMEYPCYEGAFHKYFHVSRKRFRKGIDQDKNKKIKIAGWNPGKPDKDVIYKRKKISSGTSSKNVVVKRNKMCDLQVFLKNTKAATLVADVSFDTSYKGWDMIRDDDGYRNYGVYHNKEEKSWFADIELYFKKKGKTKATVTLFLVNGQKMNFKFNITVK